MFYRSLGFASFLAVGIIIFFRPVQAVLQLSMGQGARSELYSYIPAIPFISIFFFLRDRNEIFKNVGYSFVAGGLVLIFAVGLCVAGMSVHCSKIGQDRLFWSVLALVLWIAGSFLLFYGMSAFKKAAFPLGFLLFTVPIPSFVLDPYITLLQTASADVSYKVFKMLGVPVFRRGMVFDLPGLGIEVARQCSGIRSSLALIIFTVLCCHIFLRRTVSKLILMAAVVPIAVVKNGLRIVTLGLLGAYVDKIYITNHWLHRSGGIVFFVSALITMFLPLVWGLRYLEKGRLNRKRP